jgi:Tol biopolymer transport system component
MKNMKRAAMGLLILTIWVLVGVSLPTGAAAARGTGPDDALVPAGDWQQLNPGKSRWYAFQYVGDGSQVDVRLQAEPHESAAFAVFTPDQIRRWADGEELEPVGRGSPDSSAEGVLLWSGSFSDKGTYYVVVEHSGTQPGTSYYLLEVRGNGVSFGAPAVTTPQPQPRSQPKAAAPPRPAGTLVFQTTYGGPFYTINADGSNLQRITDGIDPTWSPDGRQIAFTRWSEPRGVWVIDADGSGAWRAFDWNQARWPSWSPDSSELLFSRMTGSGRQEDVEFCFRGFCFSFPAHPHWRLGIVQLQDGSLREPPSSEVSHAPMWSPDGSRVVYDDVQGLRIQSLDGEVSYLITTDARDTAPAWSPDGGRVAFVRRQHDHWEVYVVDADGRNLRRLTDTPKRPNGTPASSAAPAWSPDGNYIAFLTDRSGRWEIWVMRTGGGGQKPMFKVALDGLRLEYSFLSERAISWTE